MSRRRARLGEVLVAAEVLSQEQLDTALKLQENAEGRKPRLGSVIVEVGWAGEEEIARALAQQLNIAYVDLSAVVPDIPAIHLVPRTLARRHQLVPISTTDEGIVIAMADPTNVVAIDDVRATLGGRRVSVVVATPAAIRESEDRFYSSSLGGSDLLGRLGAAADAEVVPSDQEIDVTGSELEALEQSAHSGPIVGLVNAILADAIAARATDIHIEPQQTEVKVRYRVDGLLRETMSLPKQVQSLVISRLKIISGMDIAERRKPQDGRSRVLVNNQETDTRVSSVPTFAGEKIVIRLLPTGKGAQSSHELGLEDFQRELVFRNLQAPQGLIIFTGPTGSGKTSTMYSGIDHIRSPERNIVTLEDPIEYQLHGINQIPIDDKTGLSFARGLRSVLRQDPDVIMVGEVRDLETAQIVMQSAMTGHLVLTSLHTNDAVSAVTRLADLGVEPYLIAAALNMVVAQRLLRVICAKCTAPAEVSGHILSLLGLTAADFEGATPMKGAGCDRCSFSGYRGRTGIYEVLTVTPQLREQITAQVSDISLAYSARTAGMWSLRRSGLAKVKAGITTLEEMLRVTHVEREEISRCPACRQEVDKAFLVCPYCQEDLSEDLCASCGREVEAAWSVCPYCRAEITHKSQAHSAKPRILVVDDDPSLVTLVGAMYGGEFEIAHADSGEEGIRKATLERPDLILLDLWLPDVMGVEIAERLRDSAATSLIPVIMLTGDDSSEVASLRAGVDDYVTKPFDEDTLRARMESALRRSGRVRVR
ncbi:ATPase, T2SS/T4P/T4SS family [soil metagenome]